MGVFASTYDPWILVSRQQNNNCAHGQMRPWRVACVGRMHLSGVWIIYAKGIQRLRRRTQKDEKWRIRPHLGKGSLSPYSSPLACLLSPVVDSVSILSLKHGNPSSHTLLQNTSSLPSSWVWAPSCSSWNLTPFIWSIPQSCCVSLHNAPGLHRLLSLWRLSGPSRHVLCSRWRPARLCTAAPCPAHSARTSSIVCSRTNSHLLTIAETFTALSGMRTFISCVLYIWSPAAPPRSFPSFLLVLTSLQARWQFSVFNHTKLFLNERPLYPLYYFFHHAFRPKGRLNDFSY